MGLFDSIFDRRDPKTELEGLDKAQKILDERHEKGLVSNEVYMKQCQEFGKRREKYMKKLGKDKYDL